MSANDADPSALQPAELAGKMFGTSFRGFDQDEVRAFLRKVADAVSQLHAERDALSAQITESAAKVNTVADLDEDQLTAALGEETARVLATARQAAVEIRAKADEHSARVLQEAGDEALATRTAADEAASAARNAAESAAAAATQEADEYATRVKTDAEAAANAERTYAVVAAATATTNADEYVARVRDEADAAATELRTESDTYAVRIRGDADAAASSVTADADAHATRVLAEAIAAAESATTEADAQANRVRSDAEEEAATVGAAAEAAAAELIETATATAEEVRAEADADAARMRSEAESLLGLRTTEAEAAAALIVEGADDVRVQGEVDAQAIIEAAKAQGRELVAEAHQVRERTLKDLARRRKASRQQVEQLRAARERLLEAYEVVRRTTDEATGELEVALPEARVAALDAGHRVEEEDEATVEEIEAEIAEARGAGLLAMTTHQPTVVDQREDDTTDLESVLGSSDQGDAAETGSATGSMRVDDEENEDWPKSMVAAEADESRHADAPHSDDGADAAPVTSGSAAALGPPEAESIEVGPPVEGDAGTEPATSDDAVEVDQLFARLRASQDPEVETPAEVHTAVVAAAAGKIVAPDDSDGQAEAANAAAPDADKSDANALASALEQRDGLAEQVERSLSRRLKRVMADEQNEVLDSIRRARKVPSADEVLPLLADHVESYRNASLDDLAEAARAGARFQGTPSGFVPSPVTELATALATELTGRVRPVIVRSFSEVDGDEDELTARIRSCYREAKSQWLAELTRHHVLVAFGQGQFEAFPEGARLRWVIDETGPACPDAEDNALAGAVTKGEVFPTGHCTSPAHPGCRCLVVELDTDDHPVHVRT